jgi:hypothetical protein
MWRWRERRKIRWAKRNHARFTLAIIDGQSWIFPDDNRNLADDGAFLDEWIAIARTGRLY